MSTEERKEATKDAVEELKEIREMKELSVQNVPISAFNDAQAVMRTVEEEVSSAKCFDGADTHLHMQFDKLYARTGTEILLIAVRSHARDYLPPCTYATTPRIKNYFDLVAARTPEQFAQGLEAFCISGVTGMSIHQQAHHDHSRLLRCSTRRRDNSQRGTHSS